MFELVLSDPQAIARHSKIPIAPEIQAYLEWMKSQGYSRRTMYKQFTHIADFGRYLGARRANIADGAPEYLKVFLGIRIGNSIKVTVQGGAPLGINKSNERNTRQ